MGEKIEGGPERLLKEPVTIKWPEDGVRADAVRAKRDEYLGRIAKRTEGYTHPEAAVVLGLMQGDLFCLDMLARAELIKQLEEKGEEGVDLEVFINDFAANHDVIFNGIKPVIDLSLKRELIESGLIVWAYCEGREAELSGGTGLKLNAEE